jgi:hypothetical protein
LKRIDSPLYDSDFDEEIAISIDDVIHCALCDSDSDFGDSIDG